jgi:hypothetical protein
MRIESPKVCSMTCGLSSCVPRIEPQVVEAACRRSPGARRLRTKLDSCAREGRVLSKREVESVVASCKDAKGNVDGDKAVVLAHHAQKNPTIFPPGAMSLLNVLFEAVPWAELINDLLAFIADVKEKEAEAKKAEELARERKMDLVKHEARADINPGNGPKAQRTRELLETPDVAVKQELVDDNKLRLTLERGRSGPARPTTPWFPGLAGRTEK